MTWQAALIWTLAVVGTAGLVGALIVLVGNLRLARKRALVNEVWARRVAAYRVRRPIPRQRGTVYRGGRRAA